MSEAPPKKKLRQTSLTDMFKPAGKESKGSKTPHMENSKIHSSDNLTTSYADTQSDKITPAEVDSSVGSTSNPMNRSPQKNETKKGNVMGKHTKKRKHLGASTSNEGSHKLTHEKSDSEEITWRGCPLSSLQVLNGSGPHVPAVHPSSDHTVLVKLPLPDTGVPEPHPAAYSDIWDQHHVRMPCSPKSLYPITAGNESLVPRWSIISKALQRDMKSVNDFQRNVLEYNSRYADKWNFKGLQQLLEKEFAEEEHDYFFKHTLPSMVSLALDLPNLVTLPPPLLTRHSTHSVTLSQIQVASLLANAFFCTFPRRNAKGGDTEYASYPDINFNRLFSHKENRSLEKIKCLLNYFRRITKKRPEGLLTFTRQHVDFNDLPSWETSSHHLPDLHIDSSGLIEEKKGLLQVDFANKFIGGGVLGLGCVQEEIRFVLSPELMVSRLFTQVLDKSEALIITGPEQFNQGSGYASNFCWTGSHQDSTKRDSWKRRLCQVVAIDALRFSRPLMQYRPPLIVRELNKVYAGYRTLKGSKGAPIGVATGNWGCGAFNGNARLKALIQLAVCGYTGRDVAYFTFGDTKLCQDLATMHIFLRENNITVGELVQVLIHYGRREWADGSDLYPYIYHSLGAYDSDTESDSNGFPSEKDDARDADQSQSMSDSKSSKSTSQSRKTESPHKSTLKDGDLKDNSLNNVTRVSAQPTEVKKEDNLTEEKIVQVLEECDRLVKDQKKKSHENTNETVTSKDNKYCSDDSVEKSHTNKSSSETVNKDIEESNGNLKALSSMFSSLDECDKKAGFE